jgi:hypothetical protein
VTGESDAGLIGVDSSGEPVELRYEDRTAHVALIGKSRFGKTTVLEHLIRDDLKQGTGLIVLDAHGDLTERIVDLAPDGALQRLTIVELNQETSFGLNLYECTSHDSLTVDRVVGNILEIFKKLFLDERQFYPVIEEGLRNSAYVIIANGHTLHEVPLLFTDRAFLRQSLEAVTNRTVLAFWREYQELPARERRELSWPVLNKVNRFLASDAIRYLVSQSRTTIPFEAALEQGEALIFRLSGDQLDRETASFLGMVFLARLSQAVAERAGQSRAVRRRVHVYLDEYGRFATRTTDRMLEEFGKYEIGLTVAHQNLEQLGGRPASTASLVMFQLDGHDAPRMALNLDTTPRRTKIVVKPRTEPQYDEQRVDRWETPEDEAEYERLRKLGGELRGDMANLHSKVPYLAEAVLRHDHRYSGGYSNRVCDCGRHGEVGGDLTNEYPPRKTTLTDIYAEHRLFNPSQIYFTELHQSRYRKGPLLTASGLVGIFDVEEDPVPGTGNSLVVTRCERYFLRPEAASSAWFVSKAFDVIRTKPRTHAWLKEQVYEVVGKLEELYKTTPFHFRLAPGTPATGAERPGDDWMMGHWVTERFPSILEELRATFTEMRRCMNEVDAEIPKVDDRKETLYKTKRSQEVVRTYLGHKRAEDVVERKRIRDQYSRGQMIKMSQDYEDREGWYDTVEELDQTHADRAAELAAELASLPKYVAYCKLLDGDGNPHEYRVATRPPAPVVEAMTVNAAAQRSLRQFGTPVALVEAEINGRVNIREEEKAPTIGRRT